MDTKNTRCADKAICGNSNGCHRCALRPQGEALRGAMLLIEAIGHLAHVQTLDQRDEDALTGLCSRINVYLNTFERGTLMTRLTTYPGDYLQ